MAALNLALLVLALPGMSRRLWVTLLIVACVAEMLADWYWGTCWSYVDLGWFQR